MDIKSLLKKTVSHTKSLFTFHTRNISFTQKLVHYNFFNKRIQIKHLFNVALINFLTSVKKVHRQIIAYAQKTSSLIATQYVALSSKSYSRIKKILLQFVLVIKSMSSQVLGFVSQAGSLVGRVFVNSGVQIKSRSSRVVTSFVDYANRLGAWFGCCVKKISARVVACVQQIKTYSVSIVKRAGALGVSTAKQIAAQTVALSKQISSYSIALFSKIYSGTKNIGLNLVSFACTSYSWIKGALLWGAANVKSIVSKLVSVVYQSCFGTKRSLRWIANVSKNAYLKLIGCTYQALLLVKRLCLIFGVQIKNIGFGLAMYSVRFGKFIFVQGTSLLLSPFRIFSNFSLLKNQYSLLIAFSGIAIILGFCAHLYFKNKSVDQVENLPLIKALEFRLTQTEAQLRHAQNQLQVMGNLRNEVRSTASKLGEAEELFKARLAQTESQLRDAQNKLQVMGNLEHEVMRTASKLEVAEESLKGRLTQTEGGLRDAHRAMSNVEHEVRRTAAKLEETEESLKKRLAQAENKVETIDSIGESLKLTGLVSLITKNKKKSLDKIKKLNGQNNELESVKEKIRKEVKRQMKELE